MCQDPLRPAVRRLAETVLAAPAGRAAFPVPKGGRERHESTPKVSSGRGVGPARVGRGSTERETSLLGTYSWGSKPKWPSLLFSSPLSLQRSE